MAAPVGEPLTGGDTGFCFCYWGAAPVMDPWIYIIAITTGLRPVVSIPEAGNAPLRLLDLKRDAPSSTTAHIADNEQAKFGLASSISYEADQRRAER
jgi:hypothetical protein